MVHYSRTVTSSETSSSGAADPIGERARQAAALRAAHVPGAPLVLPNVWDAATARAVERAGFPVVATSSAAVAESLGYADGEDAPAEEMAAAIARIVRAVRVPVTADVERGYGLSPEHVAGLLIGAGAVGCNLEDSDPRTGSLVDADQHAEFLYAVRRAASAAGADLVINARIDTYLGRDVPAPDRLAETIRRAHLYIAAGADCVYPILAAAREDIAAITAGIDAPVNILMRPGVPSLNDLAVLGVARVSFGHGLHLAAQEGFARALGTIGGGGDPYAP